LLGYRIPEVNSRLESLYAICVTGEMTEHYRTERLAQRPEIGTGR
jgi:hypothetical protein